MKYLFPLLFISAISTAALRKSLVVADDGGERFVITAEGDFWLRGKLIARDRQVAKMINLAFKDKDLNVEKCEAVTECVAIKTWVDRKFMK